MKDCIVSQFLMHNRNNSVLLERQTGLFCFLLTIKSIPSKNPLKELDVYVHLFSMKAYETKFCFEVREI